MFSHYSHLSAKYILVAFLIVNIITKLSFSIWEQFFSEDDIVLDGQAIGFSEPSCKVCDKTAPSP